MTDTTLQSADALLDELLQCFGALCVVEWQMPGKKVAVPLGYADGLRAKLKELRQRLDAAKSADAQTIATLRARLEIVGVSWCDGIDTRDETIRLQERTIAKLEEEHGASILRFCDALSEIAEKVWMPENEYSGDPADIIAALNAYGARVLREAADTIPSAGEFYCGAAAMGTPADWLRARASNLEDK